MNAELIKFGWFRSHNGLQLPWKLDADALSDDTISELAKIIAGKFSFGHVEGVPRGGLRLAAALLPNASTGYPLLIVDDVLTTGASMELALERAREQTQGVGRAIGVVIFARGPCPSWVWPIFQVSEWTQSRGTGLG
jgi:hypothetical protein